MPDEPPNANQQLLDSAIYQGLGLERVNAGMAKKINTLLVDAQEQITAKLASGKLTDWQAKKAQEFLDWSNKVIANTYDKIDTHTQEQLDGVKKAEIQKQINSVNSVVGVEISPAMSENQLKAIASADELLVNGAVMKDWWGKQAGNLQHQLLTTVQGGLVQGKSTQDIAKDIKAFMPTADDLSAKQVTAQANALARTAAATVQSEAQKKYYEQNDDIIKGIRWVSTLDSRTTPMCMALDGKTWKYGPKQDMEPVGHEVDFPGYPPIHWNCRSTTVPVLKSWHELSKKELPHLEEKTVEDAFHESLLEQGFSEEEAANIEMNQRASVDGAVPESMTYEDWLKSQPELTQKQILGPSKWQLWHDGKVDLLDMINKETLEPLTVDELVAAAEKNKALPPPPPAEEGLHGLSLAERNILTAQMTSEATSGATWSSWLNPNNGVTIDQTLKYVLNAEEQAQLQAQDKLIHLSNTADNGKFWQQSDAKLWAGQDGFIGAKLVTPSGRVITAKLKPGKEWTVADADKYAASLRAAQLRGIEDEFRAQKAAFDATGKMTVTQTEPGAVKLDSSTLKKVYGPVAAEDKPLSYLEAHANVLQEQKDKELADAQAAMKEQLRKADEAQAAYAEESHKAREAMAGMQTKIAQRDLEAAEAEHKEALATVAKHQQEVADAKAAVEELEANRAAEAKAKARADEDLAAAEQAQKEAEEAAAKAKKKSEAAKKGAATKAAKKAALAAAEAQAKADAVASWDARITTAHRQLDLANNALQAEIANQANAEKIYNAQQADLEAKKAQEKAIKKQKAEAKAALEKAAVAKAQAEAQAKAAEAEAWTKKLAGTLTEDDVTAQHAKWQTAVKQALQAAPEDQPAFFAIRDAEKQKFFQIQDAWAKQLKAEEAVKQALAEEAAAKAEAQKAWTEFLKEPLTQAHVTNFTEAYNNLVDAAVAETDPTNKAKLKSLADETYQKLKQMEDAFAKQQSAKAVQAQMQKVQEALDKKAADEAAAQAAAKAAKAATKTAQAAPAGFPLDLSKLTVDKELGGATQAQRVKDADGNLFVRKSGASPEHIVAEAAADELYRIAGANMPESKIYDTPSGPIKLARYVPDATILGDYLKTASPAQKDRVMAEVKHSFVTHALLANWDAVGANPQAGFDNIIVDKSGKPWIIDAGGALNRKGLGTVLKGKFGPKVDELQTMLDPKINPTTAPIFKGITQAEIKDQIGEILTVRNELIAATPADLRDMMRKRLDYLQDYAGVKPEQLKTGMTTWGSQPNLVQEVKDAKVTGFEILSDKDAVEDTRALVWNEKDLQKQNVVVAQLKLRPAAMNDLEELLKPLLPKTAPVYTPPTPPKGLPDDTFYQPILTASKTVNFHVNDGMYNEVKVQQGLAMKPQLEALAQTGTPFQKQMANQYLDTIKQIENSILAKPTGKLTAIPHFNQYEPPPLPKPTTITAAVQATAQPPLKVTVQSLTFSEKQLAKGEAVQLPSAAHSSRQQTYLIDMGDVQARYIPKSTGLFALQGQIELRTVGEATPGVMAKIQGALKDLGVDMTPPSDEYRKSLYLTKNMYYLGKSKLPAGVESLMADTKISDAERLQKISEIAERNFKIKLSPSDTRWQGQTAADGDGYRHYLRADMTQAKLEKDLDGYKLYHDLYISGSRTMSVIVNDFLNSGGDLTPTTERLRKGISLNKTGGQSPDTDQVTGGASYFFTRIGQMDKASYSSSRLIFKPDQLARLDAYAFSGDKYGRVNPDDPHSTMHDRKTTVAQYKALANSTNEIDFKHGFDLVTDVQWLIAPSAEERTKIIKAFHAHGITAMADGRKIENVVVLAGATL